jgi:hypothetical protein
MPFIQDDLYTVSAGASIYNYWNPFVTKFDTSSFYSWEEDNTPLYDLEERTDYLWEKMGWPTSSIPGLVFSVSGTIDTESSLSSNQFLTVQDAIDALPEVLRFPTLIEVCVDDELGDIELKDIKCVGDGKLEIVNRAFGVLSGVGDVANAGATEFGTTKFKAQSTGNLYGAINDASCLYSEDNTSELMLSSNNSMAMFMGLPYQNKGGAYYVNTAIGSSSKKMTEVGGSLIYDVDDVTLAAAPFTDTTTDPDPVDADGTDLRDSYGRRLDSGQKVVGIYAGNRAASIKVSNCEGPIWIRGFLVNGARGATGGTYTLLTDYGIEITNSHGVTIEDCGAARAKLAGLRCVNSSVSVNRRFFAARNYDQEARGTLDDYGILAEGSDVVFDSNLWPQAGTSIAQEKDTQVIGITGQKYGIKLVNSRLVGGSPVGNLNNAGSFITANTCETSYLLESSVIDLDGTLDSYNSTNGITLYNSTMKVDSFVGQSHQNTALNLINSNVEYNKNLTDLTSYTAKNFGNGATADYYPSKSFFLGNGQHIVMRGSTLRPVYSEDSMPEYASEFTTIDSLGRVDNGGLTRGVPGIDMSNSEAEFVSLFSCNNIESGGVSKGRHIHVSNGSVCNLRGSTAGATLLTNNTDDIDRGSNIYVEKSSTLFVAGPTVIADMANSVVVDDNSTAEFGPHCKNGSSDFAVDEWSLSAAGNHTSVMVYGTEGCLVANNQSTIKMRDIGHYNETYKESPSASSTDIVVSGDTTTNHKVLADHCSAGSFTFLPHIETAEPTVRLKSYNGNTSSKLLSAQQPPRIFSADSFDMNGQAGAPLDINEFEIDLLSTSQAAKDAWRQVSNGGVCVKAVGDSLVDVFNVHFLQGPINADEVFLDPSENQSGGCNDLRIWSFGGGSQLKASHLSVSGAYPEDTGYHGPRGLYYRDANDHLESYHCSDVSYTAFMEDPYASGQRFVPNLPQLQRFTTDAVNSQTEAMIKECSGFGYYEDLPLSSMAILDFFGDGCSACSGAPTASGNLEREYFRAWSVKRYGDVTDDEGDWYGFGTPTSSIANRGPYRLFLEIDPAARSLSYSGTEDKEFDSRPFQTLSQGYFLSSSCSASVSSMDDWYYGLRSVSPTSSTENDQIQGSGIILSGFSASGYFHPDKFCRPENYNIIIDESAANTFANAKNASIPILGRPKLVDIYRATATDGGIRALSTSGHGLGFRMDTVFNFDHYTE